MRLWSLHPKYLDTKGLTAAWREGLLAQKVLRGETRGYQNHPQLVRFKSQVDPSGSIAFFLAVICEEGKGRGYHFKESKILQSLADKPITVTQGQLLYEWALLKNKLQSRDPLKHRELLGVIEPEAHPLFEIVPGGIEVWEHWKEL